MIRSMTFGRIESFRDAPGLQRTSLDNDQCRLYSADHHLNQRGSTWEVTIENLITEDIFKFVSLREQPERIDSSYSYARDRLDGLSGMVIVTLEYASNKIDRKSQALGNVKRYTRTYRISGQLLVNNSFHISELGWDICLKANLEKTAGLIMQDTKDRTARSISVPRDEDEHLHASLVFGDYANLKRKCVERTSRIHMRVGMNINRDPSVLPDYIKDLRIVVLDRDFSPYQSNRMSYDPALREDEFVIENLYEYDSSELRIRWGDFYDKYNGEMFILDNIHDTLKGKLCELAIFADDVKLANYYHAHQSEELYDELSSRITSREGSHVLRHRITSLENELASRNEAIVESDAINKGLTNQLRDKAKNISELEKTIQRLKVNHDAMMSYDAVMGEIDLKRNELSHEREKLYQERYEFDQRKATTESSNRATMFKAAADMVKSWWGILLSVITIGAGIYKGYKNLKSSA